MRRWRSGGGRRRRQGYVLLLALFVLAAMLAAGAMIAGSLTYRMSLVRQQARSLHLTTLTDAALARAMAELSRDPGYRGTGGAEPFGDGDYEIAVERVGATGAVVDLRVSYGGGHRAARAELVLFPVQVTRWEPVVPR